MSAALERPRDDEMGAVDRLASELAAAGGFAPADELAERLADVPREVLTRARGRLGARTARSAETGRWWVVRG